MTAPMTAAEEVSTPVSMLWESADPEAALTERFGFASTADAIDWLGDVLVKHWGLRVSACGRLVISDANCLAWITVDGCRMIAKWSMRPGVFGRLAAIAGLTVWLGERGIPVSVPRASANILWANGRIAAILDLEETTYRRRVDDLAQAAVLLGTRYHDWRPTPAEVRGAFVAAYVSVVALDEGDAGALDDSIEAHLARIPWPG